MALTLLYTCSETGSCLPTTSSEVDSSSEVFAVNNPDCPSRCDFFRRILVCVRYVHSRFLCVQGRQRGDSPSHLTFRRRHSSHAFGVRRPSSVRARAVEQHRSVSADEVFQMTRCERCNHTLDYGIHWRTRDGLALGIYDSAGLRVYGDRKTRSGSKGCG